MLHMHLKSASKTAVQKTAKATSDLIGNKITDKISRNAAQSASETASQEDEKLIEIPKRKYISPEKRQQIIDELRLI